MFIQEKYLMVPGDDPNPTTMGAVSTITILKCKYCAREFMVPNNEVDKLTVIDVCEADECKRAYEKQVAAAKLAELKTNSSEADEVKRALAD